MTAKFYLDFWTFVKCSKFPVYKMQLDTSFHPPSAQTIPFPWIAISPLTWITTHLFPKEEFSLKSPVPGNHSDPCPMLQWTSDTSSWIPEYFSAHLFHLSHHLLNDLFTVCLPIEVLGSYRQRLWLIYLCIFGT